MKIPFFNKNKKQSDTPAEQPAEEQSIVPVSDAELVLVNDEELLDIARFEDAITLDASVIDAALFADSLIPMAAKAVDVANQWNQAIVRFPEGAGWNDLLQRKTPGWEDWKQLGILKDGKFQPQAAIQQAKLQPTAVANLALQGAAIVVGQAYMAEINQQLEGIESGIAAIQQEMKLQQEAKVEARFERLKEYLAMYGEISSNPEKRQAVQNQIEDICTDALDAWLFQVKRMQSFSKSLDDPRRMKDKDVQERIVEFLNKERDAQAAFKLFVGAEQASMQYDGNFSSNRIALEQEKIASCLEEYALARGKAQVLLGSKIDTMRGKVIAIAASEDEYVPQNPVFDAGHAIAALALRITPLALHKEAKKQTADAKTRFHDVIELQDPIEILGTDRAKKLDQMDFIYNQADTMVIDKGGVHLIKTRYEQPETDSSDSTADGVGLAAD